MTKEMHPSHRIDVLSHALLYYAYQKTDKLGKLLSKNYQPLLLYNYVANFLACRWRKAKVTMQTATENYQSLVESYSDSTCNNQCISIHTCMCISKNCLVFIGFKNLNLQLHVRVYNHVVISLKIGAHTITEETVKQWIEEERATMTSTSRIS